MVRTFGEELSIRQGYNIPSSMMLNPCKSGFFFGRTLTKDYVGKPMDIDGHIAVFGGSGSGKSIGIAVPTLSTWKGTIFSFDYKGDLVKWSKKRRTKILYLIEGQKNRYWYDPFSILHKGGEAKIVANARELAYAIIPLPCNIADAFWINAARDILTGAIVYYFNLGNSFIDTMIEIKTTPMKDLVEKIKTDKTATACVCHDVTSTPKTLGESA